MNYCTNHLRWSVLTFFVITNRMLLCIVDYYSMFPIVKKVGSLAADDLVQVAKMIFVEYGLPKKMISDAGMNFKLEML